MANNVTGLNETIATFHAQVAGITAASKEALLDVAYAGARNASRHAPVDTGRLADSFIGAGRGRDSLGEGGVATGTDKRGPYAEIGSRVEYAAKIEYTDQAMLRPAAHQMETELIEEVGHQVSRTMSRRVRGGR